MATLQRLALRGTPKATKQAARYTPAGGAERCGMCRHFAPSSSCARIEGPVSAAGWCQLYSQQVTWRPRAGQLAGLNPGLVPPGVTLDLSVMAGALDPRVTFTRASTGTYFDSTGTMQTAATNAPRWDYDPVTHALRGLLIEEARTNLELWSADLSNVLWAKSNNGAAPPAVTANQAIAPDGSVTASRVVYPAVTTAGWYSQIAQAGIAATANPYTLSIWAKGNVGGELLYLNCTPDGVTYYRALFTLTTTFQRFALSTPSLTATTWYFQFGTDRRDAGQSSTPAQTMFLWGAQLEQGAFPTSYIPTTAASVTRAQDIPLLSSTGWYSPPGGSWMAEYIAFAASGNFTRIIQVLVGDGAAPLFTGSGQVGQFDDAVFFQTANASAANTVTKGASTWAPGLAQLCLKGGAVATATGLTNGYPTVGPAPIMQITGSASNSTSGYIRRIRYWPRVLSASELQAVTT
jgi:hypothetical protein